MHGAAGALKIGQLPVQVRLDTPWPLQRIPLRATPQALAFVPEYNVYALVVSRTARPLAPPLSRRAAEGSSPVWTW